MTAEPPPVDKAEAERAFGRAIEWFAVEPIDPDLRIHSVTGGVYRVTADDQTAVLKIVRHGVDDDPGGLWVSGAEPSHRNYWKREWLAFDSGLLDGLPGRLRGPRTLLTTEHDDGECWIWMEDVQGRIGPALTLDDYRQIGFDLGTTQGAYPAGAALPQQEWLSRDWLRAWVATSDSNVNAIEDDAAWADDRLAAMRPLRMRALDLWQRRDELVAAVEAAPQTVVHLDFWPNNVVAAEDGTTVAIDWSQVGIGAIAQDLDQMTLDPVWMLVRPDSDPRQLERIVIDGYLAGLREAGCDLDVETVWRWYASAAAVKYLPLLELQVSVVADPEKVARQERRFGRPIVEILARKRAVVERAVELGEAALRSST